MIEFHIIFHIIKSQNWQGAPTEAPTEYSIYSEREQRLFHIIKCEYRHSTAPADKTL